MTNWLDCYSKQLQPHITPSRECFACVISVPSPTWPDTVYPVRILLPATSPTYRTDLLPLPVQFGLFLGLSLSLASTSIATCLTSFTHLHTILEGCPKQTKQNSSYNSQRRLTPAKKERLTHFGRASLLDWY